MSDTVKLIIEIPKDYYEIIKHEVDDNHYPYRPFVIIANGTPLDDVKAEIANIDSYKRDGCLVLADVLRVLNNIDKAESQKFVGLLNQSLEDVIDAS